MRELADLHAGGLTRIRIELEVDPAVNAAARFLYAMVGDTAGALRLLERSRWGKQGIVRTEKDGFVVIDRDTLELAAAE